MTVTLNATEVFEIAQQIERNGSMFYRKAAELFSESDISNKFLELADWEIRHEKVFKDIGQEIIKPNKNRTTSNLKKKEFDPKLMACLAVFGTVSDPIYKLKSITKITEALKAAIEKEKDTIVFYEGLKDFVIDRNNQNKVDVIIKEEKHHIEILNQALKQRE